MLFTIEPLSQGDRAFNSTYPPEPIRVVIELDNSFEENSDNSRRGCNDRDCGGCGPD
jgi:hypothetical protein